MKLPAEDIIDASRIHVCRRHVWFSNLLWKLKPIPMPGFGTFAVDDGLRLFYDPKIVLQYTEEYIPTFCAHEVQHPIREHPQRFEQSHGRFDARWEKVKHKIMRWRPSITNLQRLYNWCGDFEINEDLDKAGWKWPPDWPALMPKNYDLPSGQAMEDYVHLILKRFEDMPDEPGGEPGEDGEDEGEPGDQPGHEQGPTIPGDQPPKPGGTQPPPPGPHPGERRDPPSDKRGEPGQSPGQTPDTGEPQPDHQHGPGTGECGGCAGNPADVESLEGDDIPPKATPEEVEITKRQVAAAILEAASHHGMGHGPGDWAVKWAKSIFAPPKVDPKKLLAAHFRGAVASIRGNVDWKYGRPSRRREVMKQTWGDEAPLLPVLQGPEPNVIMVLDVSGSMGSDKRSRLADGASIVLAVANTAGVPIYGMAVDAKVQDARRVRNAADVMALVERGHGGTDMVPGVVAAQDKKYKADLIILLTDGEVPRWPKLSEMPKRQKLITVIINSEKHYYDKMPVHVKKHSVFVKSDR